MPFLFRPINLKILIDSKDGADVFSICRCDQRGIGKVHGEVVIFSHQVPAGLHNYLVEVINEDRSAFYKFPQIILNGVRKTEQLKGLGYNRPGRDKRLLNCFQGFKTYKMFVVIFIEDGNNRPGINGDHYASF